MPTSMHSCSNTRDRMTLHMTAFVGMAKVRMLQNTRKLFRTSYVRLMGTNASHHAMGTQHARVLAETSTPAVLRTRPGSIPRRLPPWHQQHFLLVLQPEQVALSTLGSVGVLQPRQQVRAPRRAAPKLPWILDATMVLLSYSAVSLLDSLWSCKTKS
jgi:hypothetical protein